MAPGSDREETTLRIVDRRVVRLPTLELVATHRDGSERTVPIRMSQIVVGTSPECELVVDDPGVSRRHCAITLTARGVVVRDLQSKNGTTVAGADVNEAFLSPSVVAKIGSTSLRLQIAGPPSDVPLSPRAHFGEVLGGAIPMRALFAQLEAAARTSSAILLHGETGTGKELLARAIHSASSHAEGPFVVLDAEREFSVAEAAGGTLFVDEVLDLSLDMQARWLRAIDAPSNHVRLVVATAFGLEAAVEKGELRRDLYFRIAQVEARVPPLRERREDIELLAEQFLAKNDPPRRLVDLPPGALAMLNGHDWPGNVRELKNAVSRLILFPHLGQAILDYRGVDGSKDVPSDGDSVFALPLREARDRVIDHFEAQYLTRRLREHQGNVSRMATAVGLSRQMVHRLLARHGIGHRDS